MQCSVLALVRKIKRGIRKEEGCQRKAEEKGRADYRKRGKKRIERRKDEERQGKRGK